MPELPAAQPWKRCLYCEKFDLWEGTLAVCNARKMVLSPQAHYNRYCNSWPPNNYCREKPDWSAEPAAEIVGGNPEFVRIGPALGQPASDDGSFVDVA